MPPLVWMAISWMAGMFISRQWLVPLGVEPGTLLLISLIPVGAFLLWRDDRSMRVGAGCALALLLGALRCQAALPDLDVPTFVAAYNDGPWTTLEGTAGGYPDVRDTYTNVTFDASRIEVDGEWQPVEGTVLIAAPLFPEIHYGDHLRVSGRLETPPVIESFDYREYLATRGIYSRIQHPRIEVLGTGEGSAFWATLYAFKDRAREVIARSVPEPEASLLQGIVLGIQGRIPRELYDEYNTTGTSHVIVISGSNITLIAAIFAAAFGRLLGKRRAYWFVMAAIALYVLLVGADSAVVRAGVMGGLYVTAIYLGRRSTAYVSLFASAILLTAIKPLALWDAGFQLSFAATLGLMLFTPPLEGLFQRGLDRFVPWPRAQAALHYLDDFLIVTLAAQILTLPLILFRFGRLSLVAQVANLLILPVQPPIMIGGGAATLVGLVPALLPLARGLAWIPWLCLAYTNAVVHWLATWPAAALDVRPAGPGWLILTYGAILGITWASRRRQQTLRRAWQWLAARPIHSALLAPLLAATILAWLAVLQLPDGRLHVAFLDVGQGDAILITTPQGRQILVDGGPSPVALTWALGKQMPFWDRSLDLLVMTHPDSDHITGLVEALDRYEVGGWLDNGRAGDDDLYAECRARLAEAGIPVQSVSRGAHLDLGEGLGIDVTSPGPAPSGGLSPGTNDDSLVLRLAWGASSFLLTGDLEAKGEQALLASDQPLGATVLKVAHHGSGGSSTPAFLDAVGASYAVISVGADNRFGHPDAAVLERLAGSGRTQVLRTDESGTVEFITDGRQLWIETDQPGGHHAGPKLGARISRRKPSLARTMGEP